MIVGIDLGTTNSLIGVWRDGKPELIPNALKSNLTPSVIELDDSGEILVGQPAVERMLTHPHLTASVFKRYMGTSRTVELGKQSFRPEELSSLVLRSLKRDAEEFIGETIHEAVISVPAYFNDVQRKATSIAGERAAAGSLSQLVRSEELQNIELKDFVHEILLDSLIERPVPPFVLLDKVAIELRWDRSQFFVNDHSKKRWLMDRLEGWRKYRKLLDAGGSQRPQSVSPWQAKVAAMITSRYDPWRFHLNRILNIGLAEAVQDRLELLLTHTPAVAEHLDDKTVEWWVKRKVRGSSLAALIVIMVVTLFFVINNFQELPGLFVVVLGVGALLSGYAI